MPQRDAAAEKVRAQRDAARDAIAANREVNTLLKEFARDEARVARDTERTKAQLARQGFAQWKAAQDVRHSLSMQAWSEEQSATRKAGNEVANLIKTAVGLQAFRMAAGAIGAEFKSTAQYIANMSKEFIQLRRSMQEVATLSGKANSSAFTIEEATKARNAHLNPTESRGFPGRVPQFRRLAGQRRRTARRGPEADRFPGQGIRGSRRRIDEGLGG